MVAMIISIVSVIACLICLVVILSDNANIKNMLKEELESICRELILQMFNKEYEYINEGFERPTEIETVGGYLQRKILDRIYNKYDNKLIALLQDATSSEEFINMVVTKINRKQLNR